MIDEKARLAAYNKYAELTGHLNTPSLDDALEAYEAAKQQPMVDDWKATYSPKFLAQQLRRIDRNVRAEFAPLADAARKGASSDNLPFGEYCHAAADLLDAQHPMGDGSATIAPVSAETVPPITPANQQPSAPSGDERFDAISIDVSTGEHDANLRAFADMPPVDIINDKGRRIALFIGELNNDMPNNTALIRQLWETAAIAKANTESPTLKDIFGKAELAAKAYLQQQEGKRDALAD